MCEDLGGAEVSGLELFARGIVVAVGLMSFAVLVIADAVMIFYFLRHTLLGRADWRREAIALYAAVLARSTFDAVQWVTKTWPWP